MWAVIQIAARKIQYSVEGDQKQVAKEIWSPHIKFMKKVISNNYKMLLLIFKCNATLILLLTAISIFNCFATIYEIIALGKLVNLLNGQEDIFEKAILILLGIAALNSLSIFLETWKKQIYLPYSLRKLQEQIQMKIFSVMEEIELLEYDNPSFYELYSIGTQNIENRISSVLNTFISLLTNSISLIGITSLFTNFSSDLMMLVLANVMVSFFMNLKVSKIAFRQTEETVPHQRKVNYIKRVFYLKEYETEIKTSKISEALKNYYKDTNQKILTLIKHYGKKNGSIIVIQGIINIVFNSSILLILVYRTIVLKALRIGDFTALLSATNHASRSIGRIFGCIPEMNENSLYLEKFFDFLQYADSQKRKDGSINITGFNSIVLKNVSFHFPSTKKNILDNINMVIEPGKTTAIVGGNGSGKTTLARLIQGLYSPSEGEILINNYDYHEVARESINQIVGTVHQEFRLFALSIGENVLMRNIKNEKEDRKTIEDALNKVGIFKKIEKSGFDVFTQISKEIDSEGVVFSSGEKQRIAIARILAKKNDVIILDEATSNIDPITEKAILKELKKMGKAVLLITHKMDNTKDADNIIVIDNGRIAEEGTHLELYNIKGKYYRMYISH